MRKLFLFQTIILCSVALFAQQEQVRAIYLINGNSDEVSYRSHITLESFGVDQSVAAACNGGRMSISSMRLNKTGGVSTIKDNKKRNGTNSVLLATSGSQVTVSSSELTSHISNSDAIAVTGPGSVVKATETILNVTRDNSAGINVYGGASAFAEDLTVNTSSLSCPAFLTHYGGDIDVITATGTLSGADSPIIYSSGKVNVQGGRILTYNSHIATVNGAGEINLDDVSYYGYKYYGFQLYNNGQDAGNAGTGNMEIKNSTIAIAEGPMFYITNTSCNLYLEKVKFGFAKNAPLVQAEAGDWGETGKNGGNLQLKALDQDLEGNIEIDAISSVHFDMGTKVSYKGAINSANQGVASVRMERKSSWTVTAHSYLESIEFAQPVEKGIKQINSKGYNIYYNPDNAANAALGGKEYPLKGGGYLLTY